jgi:TonB family protein
MKKSLILFTFFLIGAVGYSQIIDETIPVFMEKVVAKTSKAEVEKLLKERKFEIKSKEYMQNTQLMSSADADKSVMGVGNYGITCIKEFFGYGRVYMKANYTTNEGIRQELAKSGYKWSHSLDGRAVYTKNHSNGYSYTIFVNPVYAQNGTVWGMFEMAREQEVTVTQNIEQAGMEAERRQREEAEHKRREAEEIRKQQEAISNRISNAFSSSSSSSSQDTRQGNTSATAHGIATSFNLNGRSIGSGGLPRPRRANNAIQEEGRVVVNITVDPNGNVIQAEIGRGTNIESIITQECALEAAERAKFNRIQGANNQSGTITYNYKLN